MLNIVGHKKIFFIISGVFVGAAVFTMLFFGFKEGIDFAGGTLWQFKVSQGNPTAIDMENVFTSLPGISDVRVNYDLTNGTFLARLNAISEADHQKFLQNVKDKTPSFEELSFQSIGPSVGAELKRNALIAIILVLVGISFYIAFAFRKVQRPISSWKYGIITLITLFHDVAIPAGLLAILGHFLHIEIDSNFVVALLVVMGFSVHDTIVVFDRIRENLLLGRGKEDFSATINASVNQTLARSINTSLTLILVLLAMYFVGPINLRYFVLTLLVGVTTGIYSSIFIASPALIVISGKNSRN
ncbi:MAG: protein translocase subunit SecF [Patescibacteria group bacterium]|nr:protein translocase subunit SecF [Patescibacteria group bacterium]MDE2015751.1 protein translocase subunit SecF [Patescibacteria group bacterium]MDE2226808.1 protein translocase subunit SecF [Patescibacteria group bacterium]